MKLNSSIDRFETKKIIKIINQTMKIPYKITSFNYHISYTCIFQYFLLLTIFIYFIVFFLNSFRTESLSLLDTDASLLDPSLGLLDTPALSPASSVTSLTSLASTTRSHDGVFLRPEAVSK